MSYNGSNISLYFETGYLSMLYRCKKCDLVSQFGLLPKYSSLFYFLVFYVPIFYFAVRFSYEWMMDAGIFGWIGYIIGVSAISFIIFLVLNFLLGCLERLTVTTRKCPKCSERKWSFGFMKSHHA